jgi:hypothetical protein
MYDPATGQFLTIDPVVDQTRSPYGYVSGNPLNATDPTGLKCAGLLGCIGHLVASTAATDWSYYSGVAKRQWQNCSASKPYMGGSPGARCIAHLRPEDVIGALQLLRFRRTIDVNVPDEDLTPNRAFAAQSVPTY